MCLYQFERGLSYVTVCVEERDSVAQSLLAEAVEATAGYEVLEGKRSQMRTAKLSLPRLPSSLVCQDTKESAAAAVESEGIER